MTSSRIDTDILAIGRGVLGREAQALEALAQGLGKSFIAAVELILEIKGRVIVSGIGKSGHIGRKIAATLASTGTPAYFVHPSEASHGDLGMIAVEDCLLVLSNSGETSELSDILSYAHRRAIALIGVAGRAESTLIKQSTIGLVLAQTPEACPNSIVPTSSTVMTLALGDALAVALMECRKFTSEDFGHFHPGGKLGARLRTVSSLMHKGDALPLVFPHTPMSDTLLMMSQKGFGVTGVVDEDGALVGVVSDGDLRRHMEGLLLKKTEAVMTKEPVTVPPESLLEDALRLLQEKKITSVFVVEQKSALPLGLVHIHDCLRVGLG